MLRSDQHIETRRGSLWRRWIIVVWVAWWGVLYGKMVVEKRGDKLRRWIAGVSRSPTQGDSGRAASRAGSPGFSIVKQSTARPSTSQAR